MQCLYWKPLLDVANYRLNLVVWSFFGTATRKVKFNDLVLGIGRLFGFLCQRIGMKKVPKSQLWKSGTETGTWNYETCTREWVVSPVILMFYGPCDASISCIMMYHEWSWIWMMLQFLFMRSAHCSSLRLWMGIWNIPMPHPQEQTSSLVTQQWLQNQGLVA